MSDFAREIKSDQDMIDYLIHTYEVSEDYAKALTIKHVFRIKEGRKLGSYIWYVGDQIADMEQLEFREEDE